MKAYRQYRNIFELWNSRIRNTAIIRLVLRYKPLEIFILVKLSQIIVGSRDSQICVIFNFDPRQWIPNLWIRIYGSWI